MKMPQDRNQTRWVDLRRDECRKVNGARVAAQFSQNLPHPENPQACLEVLSGQVIWATGFMASRWRSDKSAGRCSATRLRKAWYSRRRLQPSQTQPRLEISRPCFEGPFGEVLRATGPMAKVNPVQFSTKYQDHETDLLYYGYRYYNPGTGRWTIRDPVEEDGGPNLYGFVLNSAVGEIDPFGTCADCICKGVSFTYKPKPGKDGKLNFEFYNPPGPDGKPDKSRRRYGVLITITWVVEGDGALCQYTLKEPPGGVTGTDPNGRTQPSDGTEDLWVNVPQVWPDPIGIKDVGRGKYTINVDITQWYACWNSSLDPTQNPPTMLIGPVRFSGSGTKTKRRWPF